MEEEKVLLTNEARKTGYPHAGKKKNILHPYFIPYTNLLEIDSRPNKSKKYKP